jgi:acyl carrier protein phosphodiesterase
MDDNPDMDESRAYAICQSQQNEGNLSELSFDKSLEEEDPCWDGYVMVGQKTDENGNQVPNCVPEEDADPANLAEDCPEGKVNINGKCVDVEESDDVPPGLLSQPRMMQSSKLETEPIEREELADGEVAYRNLKLLDEGVWTDQRSKTPTLYAAEHFDNYQPTYDSSEFQGPPVNIMHDLDADTDKPNEASICGHVEPDSLGVSNDALFGDVVLNTDKAAGAYADENLQSALESGGDKGFGGPSVELNPTEMQMSDHVEAEEEVVSAELSGLGLVMEPASKSVDFSYETQSRAVALSQNVKGVYTKSDNMDTRAKILEAIATRELNMENITEAAEEIAENLDVSKDDVMDMLDPLIDEYEGDMEPGEDAEMGDYSDSDMEDMEGEEDEEDKDMADMEEMYEMLNDLRNRLEELEDSYEQIRNRLEELEDSYEQMDTEMASEDDVEELSEEMESAKEELAEADTVAELQEAKEELDKRLSNLEEEPEDPKTLSDDSTFGFERNFDASVSESDGW